MVLDVGVVRSRVLVVYRYFFLFIDSETQFTAPTDSNPNLEGYHTRARTASY